MVASPPPANCPPGLGPKIETLPKGHVLWRVWTPAARLSAPTVFNPHGAREKIALAGAVGSPGRFDSITGDYAYLYAGGSQKATLAEAFVRGSVADPASRAVRRLALAGRLLAKLETTAPMELVSLHGDGLSRIGQDAWLTSCDEDSYELTQHWAAAIRSWADRAHGFVWRSKRANDDKAYVLFADRGADLCLDHRDSLELASPKGLALSTRLLARIGIALS